MQARFVSMLSSIQLVATFLPLLLFRMFTSGTRSRQLQNDWEIQEPTFKFHDYTVVLEYGISDRIEKDQVWYSLFDGVGCQEQSKPLAHKTRFLESDVEVEPSEGLSQLSRVSVKLDPREIEASPIFHALADSSAEIVFCVRFGLYSGDHDSNSAIEVNFLETPVKVRINMEGKSNISLGEIDL
eukprot:scaffold1830_cov117-Cylindrotheca_fusiformis.AAC.11